VGLVCCGEIEGLVNLLWLSGVVVRVTRADCLTKVLSKGISGGGSGGGGSGKGFEFGGGSGGGGITCSALIGSSFGGGCLLREKSMSELRYNHMCV
jgi:hypothetical protein